MRSLRDSSLLTLVLACGLLAGCAAKQRLEGPNYPASGPAFVRPSLANDPAALQPADLRHRIILIGDTGDPGEVEPSHGALGVWGNAASSRTTVLFLGDNLYMSGLTDDDRERGEGILRQQLAATRAQKIFVPGNHDWGGFDPTRAHILYNQEEFIEAEGAGHARFRPQGGCPGPSVVELAPAGADGRGAIVAILIDTQWWWVPADKRVDCPGRNSAAEVVAALDAELTRHADDLVIVAAHHPFTSASAHGGMPRGFVGTLFENAVLGLGFYLQDLGEPQYIEMIGQLSGPLKKNPPLVYAAGHDHALQILDGGEIAAIQVVSGAGSEDKVSPVTNIDETIFAHAHTGFVVIDVLGSAAAPEVVLRVIEPGQRNPVFDLEIPHS
ncbi:MAG: metallophosphoesterase [Deltaproteobacteria bacterium]